MGDGYIRYDNGLQICYGRRSFTTAVTAPWGTLYEANTSSITTYTFTKAFNKTPHLSATCSGGNAMFIESTEVSTTTAKVVWVARADAETITSSVDYIAIGTWK